MTGNTKASAAEGEDVLIRNLEEWAARNGCTAPKLKIVNFDDGRYHDHPSDSIRFYGYGAIAREDIGPQEDLCSVPLKLLININTAKNSDFGRHFEEAMRVHFKSSHESKEQRAAEAPRKKKPRMESHDANTTPTSNSNSNSNSNNNASVDSSQIDPNALIYLFLISERFKETLSDGKQTSFWKPYFDMLPTTFSTPLYFSDEEMDLLRGTNLHTAATELKQKLTKTYSLLFPKLSEVNPSVFPASIFSLENYIWAYSVFWSRVFPIRMKLPTPTAAAAAAASTGKETTAPTPTDINNNNNNSSSSSSNNNNNDINGEQSSDAVVAVRTGDEPHVFAVPKTVAQQQQQQQPPPTVGVADEAIPSLVPLADILNHKFKTRICFFTDYEESKFHLRTDMESLNGDDAGAATTTTTITAISFKKGQQVFNNYGGKSNDSFLLSYGFTIEGNSEDTHFVKIGFGHSNDDEKSNEELKKERLLKERGLQHLGFYLRKDSIPSELFAAMRIVLMNQEETYFFDSRHHHHHYHNHHSTTSGDVGIISPRNEIRMLSTLRGLLSQRLEKMMQYNSNDANISTTSAATFNTRNIQVYRLGQEQILRNSIERVRQMEINFVSSQPHNDRISSGGIGIGIGIDIGGGYEKRNKQQQIEDFLQWFSQTVNQCKSTGSNNDNNNNNNTTTIRIDTTSDSQHQHIVVTPPPPPPSEMSGSSSSSSVFIEVPQQYLISLETALKSEQLGEAFRVLRSRLSDDLIVTLFIIHEKHKQEPAPSLWSKFFAALPDRFDSTINFTEQELDELAGTPLHDDTLEELEQIKNTYQSLVMALVKNYPDIFKREIFTYQEYLWAHSLWTSRSIDGVLCPSPYAVVSAPRFNPYSRIEKLYDKNSASFKFALLAPSSSSSSIKGNDGDMPTASVSSIIPLDDNFGFASNNELMLHYGTCVPDNPFDVLPIQLTLDRAGTNTALSKKKLKLLKSLNLGLDHLLRKSSIASDLLTALQICLLQDDTEFKRFRKQLQQQQQQQTDMKVSKKVVDALRKILESLLEQYPTTIEEDMQGLELTTSVAPAVDTSAHRKRLCVLYRLEQKKIIARNIELLAQVPTTTTTTTTTTDANKKKVAPTTAGK